MRWRLVVFGAEMAHEDWLQTLAEIAAALSVMVFCLMPVLLNGMGIGEIGAFRISAIAFLVGLIPFTVMGFRRFRRAAGTSAILMSGPVSGATYLASGTAVVAGLACASGFPASAVPTLYLIALAGTLAIGALNFLGFAIAYSSFEGND